MFSHPFYLFRPLEVIGHDGKAANITMLPGDLVLYESHSVLHGVGLIAAQPLDSLCTLVLFRSSSQSSFNPPRRL